MPGEVIDAVVCVVRRGYASALPLPPPSKLLSFVERGGGAGTGGLRDGEPGSGYHFRGDPDWADPVPTFLLSQTPDLVHACL